eukprot:6904501-Prymnesium_polylepis.1
MRLCVVSELGQMKGQIQLTASRCKAVLKILSRCLYYAGGYSCIRKGRSMHKGQTKAPAATSSFISGAMSEASTVYGGTRPQGALSLPTTPHPAAARKPRRQHMSTGFIATRRMIGHTSNL